MYSYIFLFSQLVTNIVESKKEIFSNLEESK